MFKFIDICIILCLSDIYPNYFIISHYLLLQFKCHHAALLTSCFYLKSLYTLQKKTKKNSHMGNLSNIVNIHKS